MPEKLNFVEMDKAYNEFKSKMRQLEEYQTEDMQQVVAKMNGYFEKFKQLQSSINERVDELIQAGEETYKRLDEAVSIINRKMESLVEKAPESVRIDWIPSNFREIVEMSERLRNMNELQFERLVKLAQAFGEKNA